jgi:diguanylate cyclase (GGDEF)-like protein
MDLKTSLAFYFVSLAIYQVVLSSMALADRRVVGTRWLAYSVLVEMVKVGLQVMAGTIPRLLSTMVVNELNMAAFFTMYMGLRWFVQRERLESRAGPLVLLLLMSVYCGMFVLHIRYAFPVMGAVVVWLCGSTLRTMMRQREERFRMPAGITAALMLVQMGLVAYRTVLSIEVYRRGPDWRTPVNDPRWTYSMMFIVMLANCLLIMYVWFAAAEIYSAVEATAGIDALTGCLNRRALMKVAEHEVARSDRTGMPLTVVAMDLDHFKQVNDTFGHAGGDAMLCAVVSLLQNRLRSVDVVARTGGEEFLVLLPDTDAVSGAKVVDGLRQAVQALQVAYEGRVMETTVSAGVTHNLPRGDSWTAMMNRADRALYVAKGSGRNCVMVDEQVAKLPRRALGVLGVPQEESALATAGGVALRLIRKRLG